MVGVPQDIQDSYISIGLWKEWTLYSQAWYDIECEVNSRWTITSMLNIGVGEEPYPGIGVLWNRLIVSRIGKIKDVCNIDNNSKLVATVCNLDDTLINKTLDCDVRNINTVFGENEFDLILWSHGPEHIYRNEWAATFAKLERIASKIVILQCPWGGGYDCTKQHYSKSIRKGEFEEFGYACRYIGEEDSRFHNGLVGYKFVADGKGTRV